MCKETLKFHHKLRKKKIHLRADIYNRRLLHLFHLVEIPFEDTSFCLSNFWWNFINILSPSPSQTLTYIERNTMYSVNLHYVLEIDINVKIKDCNKIFMRQVIPNPSPKILFNVNPRPEFKRIVRQKYDKIIIHQSETRNNLIRSRHETQNQRKFFHNL